MRAKDVHSLNEGQARYILIDPALRKAGWNLDDRTQVGFEVPVDGYDAEPWNGVPEVVNLVFMKPVQSRIKLWQMIGRGTRNHQTCKFFDRLPDGRKTEFKVIDFWQNDFNKQADDRAPSEVPVLVSIFNTRLKLLASHLPDNESMTFKQTVADLRVMLDRIPQDSFPVRKVYSLPVLRNSPASPKRIMYELG